MWESESSKGLGEDMTCSKGRTMPCFGEGIWSEDCVCEL